MMVAPKGHDKEAATVDSQMPRRRLLAWLSGFGLFASGLLAVVSDWLFFKPRVTYGPNARFAIGKPEDFPPGTRIARESAHILLEGTPDGLDPDKVERALRAVIPQLDGIHHLHSWSLTDERPMVTLHATLKQGADSDRCIKDITVELERAFNVSHATIQIEYQHCDGPMH